MIPHQVPTYISWWLDPFSKVREAFQITWTDLKEYALSPFLLIGRVLNKVQKKKSTLLNNYPSLAYIIMVSTTVTTHCANTITSAKISEPFIRSKQRKASLDRPRKLTNLGVDSLIETLHAEGVSEDSAALITKCQKIRYKCSLGINLALVA